MIMVTYKHRRSDVKLLLELRYEDVHRHKISRVFLLDFPQNVSHPFEVALSSRHPDEVHLESDQKEMNIGGKL